MKTTNKDYLYSTIFRLFLSKHYRLVTISDMEEASGLTRGAIFHYAKDKQTLFRDIVDTCFFQADAIKEETEMLQDGKLRNLSLKEFIHDFMQIVDKRLLHLEQLLNMNRSDAARSYLSFLIQTQDYYPDFNEKVNELRNQEVKVWEEVVTRAQENGEITQRINPKLYAHIFDNFFTGLYYQSSFYPEDLETSAIEAQLMKLYHLIAADTQQ